MKGIVLAGGTGSRLFPATIAVSKQLIPVFDKPMIYYPLATLLEAGIREILIITTAHDSEAFKKLLGDGSLLGCEFSYAVQEQPKGIAEAFTIGADFIGNDSVCLILGDNIFYGSEFIRAFQKQIQKNTPSIFTLEVNNPKRYGVVEFDAEQNIVTIEEKPTDPKSNWAIPGIYIYDSNVVQYAKKIMPSARGEKEITELHLAYLNHNQLAAVKLSPKVVWMDAGTPESFIQAHDFIRKTEETSGKKVACLEEIAFEKGYINAAVLSKSIERLGSSSYANYLKKLLV